MVVAEHAVPGFAFVPSAEYTRNVESNTPLVYFTGSRVMALAQPLGEVCDAIATSIRPVGVFDLAEQLDEDRWDRARIIKALDALSSAGIVQEGLAEWRCPPAGAQA